MSVNTSTTQVRITPQNARMLYVIRIMACFFEKVFVLKYLLLKDSSFMCAHELMAYTKYSLVHQYKKV